MQVWAEAVSERLGELLDVGHRSDGCTVDTDAGAERVVLAEGHSSGAAARAAITLSIDEAWVEVAVHLPPEDVRAASARIADPLRALELTTALEALPEQFALGAAGDESPRQPAARFSTDRLRLLLQRAEREQRSLWLGWSIPRDVAVEHAALLDEQLEDAAVALGAVLAVLGPPIPRPEGPSAPRAHRGAASRDRRHTPGVDDERRDTKRHARARDRKRERHGELAGEPELPERDPVSRTPASREGLRASAGRARPRAGAAAGKRIEKGARVRVLEGPFSGKVGIVQELDAKGGARVMLGLLAVRLDIGDLARCSEGRNRPVLSTSHRKPAPVRS